MSELQSPEIFPIILDSLQTGIYVVDLDRKIVFWNDGAERITGYHRQDVLGRLSRENIFSHCNDIDCILCGVACPFTQTIRDGKQREAKIQLRHKQGHVVPVLLRIVPIRDHRGLLSGAALSFDQQKFSQGRHEHQHNLVPHDCLDEVTGSSNHSFTQLHLRENLASFIQHHRPFSVLSIQMDSLDEFRAKYGSQAGDAILRVVAETMTGNLRPSDFLGRWSADQFLAILVDCGAIGAEVTGKRMQKVVALAGLKWWGDELSVTVSIGHATAQPEDTIDSLVGRALNCLQEHSSNNAANNADKSSPTSKDY